MSIVLGYVSIHVQEVNVAHMWTQNIKINEKENNSPCYMQW